MQNFSHILAKNNAQIKFMNVSPIFCTKIQVFFIKILPKIEFQNSKDIIKNMSQMFSIKPNIFLI
jgi:hypothetical protein